MEKIEKVFNIGPRYIYKYITSENWKERFIGHYWATKIRRDGLNKMLILDKYGKLDYTPNCPIEILQDSLHALDLYLETLEKRAIVQDIDIWSLPHDKVILDSKAEAILNNEDEFKNA